MEASADKVVSGSIRAGDHAVSSCLRWVFHAIGWPFGFDLGRLPFGNEDAKSEVTGLITFAVTQGVALGLGVQGRGGLWDSTPSMAGVLLVIYAIFTFLTWWGLIRLLRRRKHLFDNEVLSTEVRLFDEGTVFYGRWGLVASILLSVTIGGLAIAGKLPGQPGDPGEFHGPIAFDKQLLPRWLKKFDSATTRFEERESSRVSWLRAIQSQWESNPSLIQAEVLVLLTQQTPYTKSYRNFKLVAAPKDSKTYVIKPIVGALALDPGAGAFRDLRFLSFDERQPGHESAGLNLNVESPTPSTLVMILVAVARKDGKQLGPFDPESMLNVRLKSD